MAVVALEGTVQDRCHVAPASGPGKLAQVLRIRIAINHGGDIGPRGLSHSRPNTKSVSGVEVTRALKPADPALPQALVPTISTAR